MLGEGLAGAHALAQLAMFALGVDAVAARVSLLLLNGARALVNLSAALAAM